MATTTEQERAFDVSIETGFAAEATRKAALPAWEQDPDTWLAGEQRRIALANGLSLVEARDMYRKALKAGLCRVIKWAVAKRLPIHFSATDVRFGVKRFPSGYVREGDRYVFRDRTQIS